VEAAGWPKLKTLDEAPEGAGALDLFGVDGANNEPPSVLVVAGCPNKDAPPVVAVEGVVWPNKFVTPAVADLGWNNDGPEEVVVDDWPNKEAPLAVEAAPDGALADV
jgi:hypothetical protein